MPTLHLTTDIDAPVECVFDLARSVELHTESMGPTDEKAVDGVTSGLLSEGDQVTWRARHFGVPLELTVEITTSDRPDHFQDVMVNGPFDEQIHDHYFQSLNNGTRMTDKFQFSSPLGPLGDAVDILYLKKYLRQLLTARNHHLQQVAESNRSLKLDE